MLREHLRHGGCLGEGRGATWPTQYNYGQNGLLASLSSTALRVNYQYDGRGNRTQVAANFQVTNFAYDLANRLTTETNPLNIATRYIYDAAGNRKTKTDGNNQVTTYGYDANSRLTSILFQDNTQNTYAYDARGNGRWSRALLTNGRSSTTS